MDNLNILELTSWEHLMEVTSSYLGTKIPFAYRGQPDADWGLNPSLIRSQPAAAGELLNLEKFLVREFRAQAHLALDAGQLPQSGEPDAAWWALMRHYGAPTRLLDWTESPLVAAYFAVESLPDRAGALYLIDRQAIDEGLNDFFAREGSGLSDAWPLLFEPDARPHAFFWSQMDRRSARLAAQQGLFSISMNVANGHEALIRIANLIAYEPVLPPAAKWIFPAPVKQQILRNLRLVNIAAHSLFPGAEGLGRSMAELAKLGPVPPFRERFLRAPR